MLPFTGFPPKAEYSRVLEADPSPVMVLAGPLFLLPDLALAGAPDANSSALWICCARSSCENRNFDAVSSQCSFCHYPGRTATCQSKHHLQFLCPKIMSRIVGLGGWTSESAISNNPYPHSLTRDALEALDRRTASSLSLDSSLSHPAAVEAFVPS